MKSLRIESLEDRSVPAANPLAHDQLTIAVGFYTGDPSDPVVARAVPVADGQTVDQALAACRLDPAVAYAEPNYTVGLDALPNDTYFGLQYGQNNTGQSAGLADADMDAPEAWDLTTGSLRTTVAVIDTGVDYTHPDLYRNVWLNQAEIPSAVRSVLADVDADGLITFWDLNNPANIGAGKITDLNVNGYIDGGDVLKPASLGGWADGTDGGGNGYLDDLVGWDFAGNDNDPMDLTAEGGGHGTHVAGTVGATGNNGAGVTGVAWRVQMMALRFLGPLGGDSVAAGNAIRYSAANGAVVSNNSWGGGAYSQTIYDAIAFARARGQVFVAAAGNDGLNNDLIASYPTNYSLDNIVAVAATDRTDALASFSNYGRSTVDLAAAGVDVPSTYPGGQYVYMSGTSMATPQVAGAFALLYSQSPTLNYADAIGRVLRSVDPIPALATTTVTGGRVNAYRALTATAVDVTGAAVTGMTPNATGSSPVSAVRVTFSEPVDAATFTAADVTVTGPNGVAVAVTGVTAVGTTGTQFDVTFASQSAAGTYTVRVGPGVADRAGNLMDQDRDGLNGEAGQDQFVGSFTVTAPPATTTFSNTTPVTIYDRMTVVSRITVNQDLTISDLNVLVNLTHTYDGDLGIALRAPDGTTVWLFYQRGGSGDNLSSTVFDDEASAGIWTGVAPFRGSYRPEQLLSAFDGKNARGTWELRVTDYYSGYAGQLKNWSLTVTSGGSGTLSARAFGLRPVDAAAAPARPVPQLPVATGSSAAPAATAGERVAPPAASQTRAGRVEHAAPTRAWSGAAAEAVRSWAVFVGDAGGLPGDDVLSLVGTPRRLTARR